MFPSSHPPIVPKPPYYPITSPRYLTRSLNTLARYPPLLPRPRGPRRSERARPEAPRRNALHQQQRKGALRKPTLASQRRGDSVVQSERGSYEARSGGTVVEDRESQWVSTSIASGGMHIHVQSPEARSGPFRDKVSAYRIMR